MAVMPSQWLTIRDAAEYAHVSQSTVRRWLREGMLRRGGYDKVIRIKLEWLDQFLEQGGGEDKP